jgi:hypothetical protein
MAKKPLKPAAPGLLEYVPAEWIPLRDAFVQAIVERDLPRRMSDPDQLPSAAGFLWNDGTETFELFGTEYWKTHGLISMILDPLQAMQISGVRITGIGFAGLRKLHCFVRRKELNKLYPMGSLDPVEGGAPPLRAGVQLAPETEQTTDKGGKHEDWDWFGLAHTLADQRVKAVKNGRNPKEFNNKREVEDWIKDNVRPVEDTGTSWIPPQRRTVMAAIERHDLYKLLGFFEAN